MGDLAVADEKIASKVRKSVDPGAKIVAPAMVTRLGYQQKGIKDFFRTKVGGAPVWKYVDAISLNLYPLDAYPQPNPTRGAIIGYFFEWPGASWETARRRTRWPC